MSSGTMIQVTKRIHRNVYPHTDHGHTWVEVCWYEDELGRRRSPQFPVAGTCQRLLNLPGGPIPLPDWEYEERNFEVVRTVHSEATHKGFHRVGPVSITT